VACHVYGLNALQDEGSCEKNTGEYKSRNVLFYEIWCNIVMVYEYACDTESNFHLRVSIQYAETCMWRLVISK
jgi:hypothetical protein